MSRRLPYPDDSFDYVIASDLFEHLPIDGMGRALDQAARLARCGGRPDVLQACRTSPSTSSARRAPTTGTGSVTRSVEAELRDRFPSVTATPIAPWLAEQYGYRHSYNRNAWTIVAERPVVEPAIDRRRTSFKTKLIAVATSFPATAFNLLCETATRA